MLIQWLHFYNERPDGVYGQETFYIVARLILLAVYCVPGLIALFVGIFKVFRALRTRPV
jgi:hypothetical protein